ncbi:F4 family fimbrial subunit [Yersinia enterocolitica]|uniref:F4 family fimbrial subunit n=1 Tax=Yersinia enterocolitica TaxID=630 RepID=UPI0030CE05B2
MKLRKITMLMACAISAPALAWTAGDFNGNVDIGGSITPEQYSQSWQWESGTDLNNFVNSVQQMTEDSKKLDITAEKGYLILRGTTTAAVLANPGEGAIPNIAFSDYEGNSVSLNQDSGNAAGTGYFELPIKDDSNQKLGTLRVNTTAAGLLVGAFDATTAAFGSVKATSSNHAFYGGLFKNPFTKGIEANSLMNTYNLPNKDALLRLVHQHPNVGSRLGKANPSNMTWSVEGELNATAKNIKAPSAASYVMAVQKGQLLNATFDNPITSTTKWSAPLNIAVTYN